SQPGGSPGYEQRNFAPDELNGRLRLIAAPGGRDGAVTLRQDAYLYATRLSGEHDVTHTLAAGRRAYVQVARGNVQLNGVPLVAGDGARVENETTLRLNAGTNAEVLLFDLP
ncbi:MAG: pirin family protein, partial [Gammaproteobacteria bacterium]|nr:pirin family protein [Gammaproteobacteria bacterium]